MLVVYVWLKLVHLGTIRNWLLKHHYTKLLSISIVIISSFSITYLSLSISISIFFFSICSYLAVGTQLGIVAVWKFSGQARDVHVQVLILVFVFVLLFFFGGLNNSTVTYLPIQAP